MDRCGCPGPFTRRREGDPSDHWSFQPPVEATITTRGTHPIDALLQPIHEEHEVEPQAISPPAAHASALPGSGRCLPEPEEVANA